MVVYWARSHCRGHIFDQTGAKTIDKFAYLVDKYLLRAPIVGDRNQLGDCALLPYASTTFAAGVPLVEALGSAAGAAGNRLYYDAIKLIQDDVATGQQLQFSMRASGLFPNMVRWCHR